MKILISILSSFNEYILFETYNSIKEQINTKISSERKKENIGERKKIPGARVSNRAPNPVAESGFFWRFRTLVERAANTRRDAPRLGASC